MRHQANQVHRRDPDRVPLPRRVQAWSRTFDRSRRSGDNASDHEVLRVWLRRQKKAKATEQVVSRSFAADGCQPYDVGTSLAAIKAQATACALTLPVASRRSEPDSCQLVS